MQGPALGLTKLSRGGIPELDNATSLDSISYPESQNILHWKEPTRTEHPLVIAEVSLKGDCLKQGSADGGRQLCLRGASWIVCAPQAPQANPETHWHQT